MRTALPGRPRSEPPSLLLLRSSNIAAVQILGDDCYEKLRTFADERAPLVQKALEKGPLYPPKRHALPLPLRRNGRARSAEEREGAGARRSR